MKRPDPAGSRTPASGKPSPNVYGSASARRRVDLRSSRGHGHVCPQRPQPAPQRRGPVAMIRRPPTPCWMRSVCWTMTGDGVRDSIRGNRALLDHIGQTARSDLRLQIIEGCGTIWPNAAYRSTRSRWTPEPGLRPARLARCSAASLTWPSWPDQPHPARLRTLAPGRHVPGPILDGFNGWQGVNVSGWSNEAYDAACNEGAVHVAGAAGQYGGQSGSHAHLRPGVAGHALFTRMRLAATTPNVLNFRLDPTQPSAL